MEPRQEFKDCDDGIKISLLLSIYSILSPRWGKDSIARCKLIEKRLMELVNIDDSSVEDEEAE